MEGLTNLFAIGFPVALQPLALAMIFAGVILGLIIGVLPGLGGTSGVAILLPLTAFVDPTVAIMLLSGIYWGALFGGAITSVLFNIPGEPWSVALLFDGHPLAKLGKTGVALTATFIASFVGGLFSTVLFTMFAPPLAELALKFGPPEYFAIMMIAFGTFVGLSGRNPFKTLIAIAIGFLLAAVGFDLITGQPRLNFGLVDLQAGFHFVPVTIGLFGIGEVLATAEERGALKSLGNVAARVGLRDVILGLRDAGKHVFLLIFNSTIGFFVGLLPGTGATPASFLGYGLTKQYVRNSENFGKGDIRGIYAPQAAANSAGVASLLPMITLGVPGSPTAAVIMAGLFIWGLIPGPALFIQQPEFVWGLIASMYVAQTAGSLICLVGVPLLAMLMRVPFAILTPLIVIVSLIGGYVIRFSMLDVWFVLLFGVIGFTFRKLKYPLAPLVVALVLGNLTESALRQSLIMGHGSLDIFLWRPFGTPLLVVAILFFLLPVFKIMWARRKSSRDQSQEV